LASLHHSVLTENP